MNEEALMRDSLCKAAKAMNEAAAAHAADLIIKNLKEVKYHITNAFEEIDKALAEGSLK